MPEVCSENFQPPMFACIKQHTCFHGRSQRFDMVFPYPIDLFLFQAFLFTFQMKQHGRVVSANLFFSPSHSFVEVVDVTQLVKNCSICLCVGFIFGEWKQVCCIEGMKT